MISLRGLTTQSMISVTAAWLDPKRDRPLFNSLPLLAPLLPAIQSAHDALVANQKGKPAHDPEAAALQAEAMEVDAEHDRVLRGIHAVLGAFAELGDDDEAAAYLALRDQLFPAGLSMITRSYVDEGAEAELVAGRLAKSDHALLAKLPIPGGKLKDAFDRWVSAAKRLKSIEAKRHKVEASAATADTVRGNDVVRARMAWVRAVRAVEVNLELESKAEPNTRVALLGPLELAARKSARRAAGKSATAEDTAPVDAEPNS